MIKIFFKNKLNKRINFLILINIILVIILVISFLPKKQKEFFNTSLLNKNLIDEIQEIILSVPNDHSIGTPANLASNEFDTIKIIKEKKNFIFHTKIGKYKIQKELLDKLFYILTKNQKLLFITDSANQFENFGLDNDNAIKIQLIDKNRTIIKEFFFGKQDILGNNIFVRLNSTINIFMMPNIISNFLTTKTHFWIDLQIYKNKLSKNKIQSIQKNGKHIVKNKINEIYFDNLELFLKQFSCIDIFPATVSVSTDTEYFEVILGNDDKIKIELTPTHSKDYILYDSNSENSFIISSYTKNRINELLDTIF